MEVARISWVKMILSQCSRPDVTAQPQTESGVLAEGRLSPATQP